MNKFWIWATGACLVAAVPAFSQDSLPDVANAGNPVDAKTSYMMSLLLERGKAALERGDVSSARALLKQPADHGVAEATRCLAQSYDPIWLTRHNVVNLQSFEDAGMAAELYVHAAHLGDPIAIAQLNAK